MAEDFPEPPLAPQQSVRPVKFVTDPPPSLKRMRALSYMLDQSITLPGGYRIGLDPVVGLLPGFGDFLTTALSLYLIFEAALLGVRKRLLLVMLGNVVLESLAGTIPLVGDVFDAVWKANARNLRLVEAEYHPGLKPRSVKSIAATFGLIALLILSGLCFVIYTLVALSFAFFQRLFS